MYDLTKFFLRLFFSVVREIEERRDFLDEMQKLGASNFRQYEGMVRNEIAQKTDELERLKHEVHDHDDHDDDDVDMEADYSAGYGY